MSTNYYLHKDPYGPRHIGKRYFAGADGVCFSWAISLGEMSRIVETFEPEKVEVRDEYGAQITLATFIVDVLRHVKNHDYSRVGCVFS